MLGVIFLICLYMAMRQAAGDVQAAWGKSRTSGGRRVSSGQVARTLNRVLSMAPVARHGFATGWHQESQRQHAARAARAKARADHLETRAKLAPEIKDHNRRAAAAKEQIRTIKRGSGTVTVWDQDDLVDDPDIEVTTRPVSSEDDEEDGGKDRITYSFSRRGQSTAWSTDDPGEALARAADASADGNEWDVYRHVNGGPGERIATYQRGKQQEDGEPPAQSRRVDGKPETEADKRFFDARQSGYKGWIDQDGYPVPDGTSLGDTTTQEPSTKGNSMAASEMTYTQHRDALAQVRELAEEIANDKRLTQMQDSLDQLTSLGLDRESLSEAAELDEQLSSVQKGAQEMSDRAESALNGLEKRHGGISEAVQDSPVDQPAQPEYYAE